MQQKFSLDKPLVMGILNLTPDSFYDGGKYSHTDLALQQVARMVDEGVDILDIGGVSTRPGSIAPTAEEEWLRMADVLIAARQAFPSLPISIDTYRADVARRAIDAGADIINDVVGGTMDSAMFETVAALGCPYVLTHIQNTPDIMQQQPFYKDVVSEIAAFFEEGIVALQSAGVSAENIILDVGFGMGKTLEHNYTLLAHLNEFKKFGLPLLAGVSHKSMLWKFACRNSKCHHRCKYAGSCWRCKYSSSSRGA